MRSSRAGCPRSGYWWIIRDCGWKRRFWTAVIGTDGPIAYNHQLYYHVTQTDAIFRHICQGQLIKAKLTSTSRSPSTLPPKPAWSGSWNPRPAWSTSTAPRSRLMCSGTDDGLDGGDVLPGFLRAPLGGLFPSGSLIAVRYEIAPPHLFSSPFAENLTAKRRIRQLEPSRLSYRKPS